MLYAKKIVRQLFILFLTVNVVFAQEISKNSISQTDISSNEQTINTQQTQDANSASNIEETSKNNPIAKFFSHFDEKTSWTFLFLVIIFCISLFGIVLFSEQTRNYMRAIGNKSLQLEKLASDLNVGIIEINQNMKIEFANQAFATLLQYKESDLKNIVNSSFDRFVQEKDEFLKEIGKLFIKNDFRNLEKNFSLQVRLLRRDGSNLPVILNGSLSISKENKQNVFIIIFDNSNQTLMLEKYQDTNKRYETIMKKTNEIQYDINLVTGEVTTDDSFYTKFGWNFPHRISPSNVVEIWHLNDQQEDEFKSVLSKCIRTGEANSTTVKIKKQSGIELWCNILINPVVENGVTTRVFGTIEDVDFEVREHELILFKAQTDSLTGLYQKETFFELCKKFIAKSITDNNTNSALIFLDLDNFKQVNDDLGHLEGDRVICDVARKLQIIFSQYDIISRFGGDEFCVFVKNIPINTLTDKLNWILEKIATTYSVNDKKVQVTASIGVSLFPKDGNTLTELMDTADKALYCAKNKGKNQFSFY